MGAEALMGAAAFAGFFMMWVVLPSKIRSRAGKEEEE